MNVNEKDDMWKISDNTSKDEYELTGIQLVYILYFWFVKNEKNFKEFFEEKNSK